MIRLADGEIRHYGGPGFIFSRDHGFSWKTYRHGQKDTQGNVKRGKAASAVSPATGTYLCAHSNKSGMFVGRSSGVDEKTTTIKINDRRFIMIRPPLFLKSKNRVLLAGHTPDRPHQIGLFWSDDDGQTWASTMLPVGPRFEVKPPHKKPRWENWCVEPTILEMNDGRLWMIARTSRDRHYESFSKDGGETWSPWRASPFYGTLTMPTLFRLSDGHILLFWCNTTPLPESDQSQSKLPKTAQDGTWEDVFTNRDALHAAISDDDGKTWRGFREIRLNPFRNAEDYGDRTTADWSVHQTQAVELPLGKVLIANGQDKSVRALIMFDPDWLLEDGRKTNFENGLEDWSAFRFSKGVRGHCAYNRTDGPLLLPNTRHAGQNMIRLRHRIDPRLVFDRDGAIWNFPAAKSGKVHIRIKPLSGGKGGRICLLDRWVSPTDPVIESYAMFVLRFDEYGRIAGNPHRKPALKVGRWNVLKFEWNDVTSSGCTLHINGKAMPVQLPLLSPSQHGLSYIHFQSLADTKDTKGFIVESVEALHTNE